MLSTKDCKTFELQNNVESLIIVDASFSFAKTQATSALKLQWLDLVDAGQCQPSWGLGMRGPNKGVLVLVNSYFNHVGVLYRPF